MKRGWSAVCDRCGFEFKSYQLQKEWNGLMTCKECWEPRHPQDFVRVPAETVALPWTRPEPPDEFLPVCTAITIQAIADVGTAGCMIANYTNLEMFECTFSNSRAIAEIAVAGCAIAGNLNYRLGNYARISPAGDITGDGYVDIGYWEDGYVE